MDQKYVFQGVGHHFNGTYERYWDYNEKRESTFVFIGKNLSMVMLRDGFDACHEMRQLRFPIGTHVLVNVGTFERGIVIQHWDEGCAYRIQLYNGREIRAPVDSNHYVRKGYIRSAMNNLSLGELPEYNGDTSGTEMDE